MKYFQIISLLFVTIICLAEQGFGQSYPADQETDAPTAFWPEGTAFDAAIPTPRKHFGFPVGMRHLRHDQIVSYIEAVAAVSNRVSVYRYGQTHGERPLLMVTITAPANRRRIKKIQEQHRQLARPEKSADVSLEKLPVVINMGYGVHGDEPSATNCTPLVLHYLAAAKGKRINEILNKCVILLDPSLNPDGFSRFAGWANRYRGRIPNEDPQHVEHNQGWPPGRVNYYWFDLNRDWLPLTQPESQARMNWYHRWKPNVVLDFHEMGTQSTYFFQPGVRNRTNPLTPDGNIDLTRKFAGYHAKALDKKGSLYFTGERFDDFYMGKGSTYPDLHGSVGILFEQASSRGHVQMNQDGRLTFAKTIRNHFTTSLSSLRATVDLREELLNYKRDFYKKSSELADADEVKTMVFTCPHNRTRLTEFARVLRKHDIKCYQTKEKQTVGDVELVPGESLIVPMKQPEYRFLKSLLMREKSFEENVFYDVSTWTLSLAYDLNQVSLAEVVSADGLKPFDDKQSGPRFRPGKTAIGYLVDFRDDRGAWLLAQMLRSGINVRVATKPFEIADGAFEPGTLFVPARLQPGKKTQLNSLLNRAAKQGAKITQLRNGLADDGIDMGSPSFVRVEKPKIVMPTGHGVSAYSAGQVWHLLDVKYQMQISMVDQARIVATDLQDYDLMVLAEGSYRFKKAGWGKIQEWVAEGNTIVAFGESINDVRKQFETDAKSKETPATAADDPGDEAEPDKEKPPKPNQLPKQLPFDGRSRAKALQLISGAIFNTQIDRTHPLMYGFTKDRLPVFRDHETMLEPSDDPYCNPAIYDSEDFHLAGYCSDENLKKFGDSASVVILPVGKGRVILMAENPNFRAFWHGTSRMFLNSIFFRDIVNP